MPLNIIEKNCVRIRLKDGPIDSLGSGVLVSIEDKSYLLTAYHCLNTVEVEKIIVERQQTYTSPFEEIRVCSVLDYHPEDDWILLELEYSAHSCGHKLGKNFLKEEKVDFYGYQKIVSTAFRPWKGEVLLKDENRFLIKIIGDTFQQAGEEGSYVAKGLSGSGVYVIKNNVPYLVGILCAVKKDKAWNDDIDCCPINCIDHLLPQACDFDSVSSLKNWIAEMEITNTSLEIESWKKQNIVEFDNIHRKNKVLYEEGEVDRITAEEIKQFLSKNEALQNLEDFAPKLYLEYLELIQSLKTKVENTYSRTVSESNEAKDKKLDLENYLEGEIEKIYGRDAAKYEITKLQIIKWLLDCTLNFTKKTTAV